MVESAFTRARCLILALALISVSACAAPSTGGSSAPSASVPSTAETIALPYTADYLLFQDGIDADDYPIYGLTDKDKNVLLPAEYREIAVSESGLIFTLHQDGDDSVCQIFSGDGSRIGPDYSWIEYAWTDADGNPNTYPASTVGHRPVAPYVAQATVDGSAHCRILDENGKPKDAEPYEDIRLWPEGTIYACRDGTLFIFNTDGNVETRESKIEETFFDGKYQVKYTHQNAWGSLFYSLLDKDGKEIAPPKYSRIEVPFEDRYVLYDGWTQTIDGTQAFLYDDSGKLLADNSNRFGFITTPDSGYIGVSMIGNVFDGGIWSPESRMISDAAGNPEPHGYYFVDRDGERIGERYTYIDFFINEADAKTGVHYTTDGQNYGSTPTTRSVALTTPVADAYFIAIKQDGSQVNIPLAEKLIK